jgi:hypothetical protein
MNGQTILWANTAHFPRDFTERSLSVTFQSLIAGQTFLVSQYDVKTNMKHYESNPVHEDMMDGIRNKKGE